MCVSNSRKWDTERLTNAKTETLSKEKGRDWNDWPVKCAWESGGLNKERINEMNPIHGHFFSCKIMHCITFAYYIKHMSSSHLKQESKVSHPIKASERPSRRKKIIQIDQSFKNLSQLFQNSTNRQPGVRPGWRFLKPLCGKDFYKKIII